MGQSSHSAESPQTQNQNNAMSNDPQDGHRLTDKPGKDGSTPVEQPPEHDAQNKATVEEFGKRGMGVAAKE